MRYSLLAVLTLTILFAACTTGTKKPYKQYQGISYEQYEQNLQRQGAGIVNIDGSPIDQTNIDAPSFSIEYDENGNEVIESTGSNYGEAVVVMAAKKIYLSRDASQRDVYSFQKALDAAYTSVMMEYRPSGFTYSMSPAGPVNPLSIMDVQCILGENSANAKGKSACDLFFKEIPEHFERLKNEAAQ